VAEYRMMDLKYILDATTHMGIWDTKNNNKYIPKQKPRRLRTII
jgi:hypothetical protein